jgi:WD40 repeat protein
MPADSRMRPIAFLGHGKLDDFITGLAWSADGSLLAAGSVSGQLAIYHAADGQIMHRIEQAHADGCDALAWRPDMQALATAGRDGTWRLWRADDAAQLAEHDAGALWPEHLAWSPQPLEGRGHWLVLGAGSSLSFWDEKGAPIRPAGKLPRTISDVGWLGGSTVAVATSTGVTYRNAVKDTEERLFPSKDSILTMSISPSGRWLMTGNQDCSVHVWNTENGAEMHMRGYAAKVRQMAWHRGSRWLAAGGGPGISVWDCSGRGPEGRQPTILDFHQEMVSALHYQPRGDWLASGARDGGVAVWSPTQRQQRVAAGKIASGVTRAVWSPDGARLAVGGEAGEIQILGVE